MEAVAADSAADPEDFQAVAAGLAAASEEEVRAEPQLLPELRKARKARSRQSQFEFERSEFQNDILRGGHPIYLLPHPSFPSSRSEERVSPCSNPAFDKRIKTTDEDN